jgi:hypothetical protein
VASVFSPLRYRTLVQAGLPNRGYRVDAVSVAQDHSIHSVSGIFEFALEILFYAVVFTIWKWYSEATLGMAVEKA